MNRHQDECYSNTQEYKAESTVIHIRITVNLPVDFRQCPGAQAPIPPDVFCSGKGCRVDRQLRENVLVERKKMNGDVLQSGGHVCRCEKDLVVFSLLLNLLEDIQPEALSRTWVTSRTFMLTGLREDSLRNSLPTL
jgi:hypothetical protein